MIGQDGALRCDGCGKMMALKVDITEGKLEIYCPRCHQYHRIEASTSQTGTDPYLVNQVGTNPPLTNYSISSMNK